MIRFHALALAAALPALAACGGGPKPLPKPDGHVFRLNPDRWGETVNDLRQPPTRLAVSTPAPGAAAPDEDTPGRGVPR